MLLHRGIHDRADGRARVLEYQSHRSSTFPALAELRIGYCNCSGACNGAFDDRQPLLTCICQVDCALLLHHFRNVEHVKEAADKHPSSIRCGH
ncbi:hypothetical protein D9M73_252390 [compost metagenome]